MLSVWKPFSPFSCGGMAGSPSAATSPVAMATSLVPVAVSLAERSSALVEGGVSGDALAASTYLSLVNVPTSFAE